jgi:hypothetical protein
MAMKQSFRLRKLKKFTRISFLVAVLSEFTARVFYAGLPEVAPEDEIGDDDPK